MQQNHARILSLELVSTLLKSIQICIEGERSSDFFKSFMEPKIACECLNRVLQISDAYNLESKLNSERLNLNFMYSLLQVKYHGCLPPELRLNDH